MCTDDRSASVAAPKLNESKSWILLGALLGSGLSIVVPPLAIVVATLLTIALVLGRPRSASGRGFAIGVVAGVAVYVVFALISVLSNHSPSTGSEGS